MAHYKRHPESMLTLYALKYIIRCDRIDERIKPSCPQILLNYEGVRTHASIITNLTLRVFCAV